MRRPHRIEDRSQVSMRRRYRAEVSPRRTHAAGGRCILLAVTAPRTGFAYLDRCSSDPGRVLAFAHRGGAYHPEIEGLENTLAAFRHAVGARLRLPRDRRARHPRRRAARLPRHRARPGHRPARARSPTLSLRRGPRGPGRRPGGRCRRWPSSSTRFPDARFNIDLKSDGAVPRAGRLHRGARGLGPGARRLVLRAAAGAVPRRSPAAGSPTSARRRSRSRPSGCCPSARLAGLAHRRRVAAPPDPAPARPADGRHPGLRTPGARRRQARARLDDRRPRRDARAARPGRRRPVHRPHRHTQGRARRARPVEGVEP